MKFGRRRTYFKQIESTALTDIVFLLLIFFLLTSSFVSRTGIKVDLPGADKTSTHEIKKEITISINDKSQVFLNDDLIRKEDLVIKLQPILKKDAQKLIIFRPDKRIRVEQLVELMDMANAAGASRLIIATKVNDLKTEK